MIRTCFTTVGVVLLLVTIASPQNVGAARLRAGSHKVDFTPNATELQLSTDSIRDHLYARAIVVDGGSTCAVLVGIDLGAAPNQIVDDAIARASKSTGCPSQNFIISATHTHSSNTQGLGQGAPLAKTVADAIVEAATVAKSRLAPARVGYPYAPEAAPTAAGVPMIICSTENEQSPAWTDAALMNVTLAQVADRLKERAGFGPGLGDKARGVVDAYAKAFPDKKPVEIWSLVSSNLQSVVTLADAKVKQPAPVFVSWFAWQSPLFDGRIGAFHCVDICF